VCVCVDSDKLICKVSKGKNDDAYFSNPWTEEYTHTTVTHWRLNDITDSVL
jgi:hypothetical protein